MDKRKHAALAVLACALLAYGVASIEPAAGWGWKNGFAAAWSSLALLVCAAHAQRLFMRAETKTRLAAIRREKRAAWERKLAGRP